MLIAISILAVLLAIQTVRSWWYRKLWRSSVTLTNDAEELIDKLLRERVLRDAELRETRTQLNSARAGVAYVEKHCDEWPEVLDR